MKIKAGKRRLLKVGLNALKLQNLPEACIAGFKVNSLYFNYSDGESLNFTYYDLSSDSIHPNVFSIRIESKILSSLDLDTKVYNFPIICLSISIIKDAFNSIYNNYCLSSCFYGVTLYSTSFNPITYINYPNLLGNEYHLNDISK